MITLMGGRARPFGAQGEGPSLSLTCLANGRARYVVRKREITVNDCGWLIVNRGQPYSPEIDSPTLVKTYIVWFLEGWAEEVERSLTTSVDRLVDEEHRAVIPKTAVEFFERYSP